MAGLCDFAHDFAVHLEPHPLAALLQSKHYLGPHVREHRHGVRRQEA
jgi:hypothetical protein